MEITHLTVVFLALALVLANAMAVWLRRVRRLSRENPEAQCRREIQALRGESRTRASASRARDVWEAGAAPSEHSGYKKAVAWVTIGSLGCGGCGGCGCGG
ncbi:hypothetical protein ABQF34_25190 [Mycolicibacterium boenickei]